MVQGAFKKKSNPKAAKANSGGLAKKAKREILVKKGNARKLPKKGNYVSDAYDDQSLSKAINKSNEQKIAAKVVQSGGKLSATDLKQKGKELAKEQRRDKLKKKLGRTEEKLKVLEQKLEK